jgi:two-component system sensor histidine kinase UhpB
VLVGVQERGKEARMKSPGEPGSKSPRESQAEAELRRAHERFQLAERAANGFVYEWDVRTGELYRSEGIERLLGYRPEDIPPSWAAWAQLVYPGDWQATTDAEELAYLEALPSKTLETEYRLRHRDGHYLTVADYALIERDEAGKVTRLIGQTHDITERKRAEEALRQAHDELEQRVAERTRDLDSANRNLRRLSQRILEIQESERHRIARELHDEIGQQLTGIKMLLDSLDERLRHGPDDDSGAPPSDARAPSPIEQLAELRAIVANTLEGVRDLSLDLRPAVLDSLGLLPALRWLFERYTHQTGVQVDFAAEELTHRLPTHLEAGVYRLVQEALTNVARHASVSTVTVQLYVSAETLSLYVVDAGVGFDVAEALAAGASTGLVGMRERAALLGGTLHIESLPGEGATIQADFSIPQAIEEARRDTVAAREREGRRTAQEDAPRDRERDQRRDAARDAARDARRGSMRDAERDAERDAVWRAILNRQARREEAPPEETAPEKAP